MQLTGLGWAASDLREAALGSRLSEQFSDRGARRLFADGKRILGLLEL